MTTKSTLLPANTSFVHYLHGHQIACGAQSAGFGRSSKDTWEKARLVMRAVVTDEYESRGEGFFKSDFLAGFADTWIMIQEDSDDGLHNSARRWKVVKAKFKDMELEFRQTKKE